MKKRYWLLLFISLIVAAGGVIFWYTRPDPDPNTKFVQNVRKADEQDNATNSAESRLPVNDVSVKEPGQSALLPNPNHTYQTFNNCGPATLSMILSYWGSSVSQNELGDKMRPYQVPSGDNDDKTIFTYEFVDWAEQYGYEAVGRVNGDIELLKSFTANGIPVVVKTWLNPGEDIGHFRIVRGFDEQRQVIIQDDSYQGPNKRFSYYEFLSMWQPFNYNYIIVYTPQQEDLVNEILGQETDAQTAWQNALTRAKKEAQIDPDNPYPYFNMSTAHYHLGQYEDSVSAFEKVENELPKRMLWYQIEPIQAYRELGNYDRVFSIIENILNNGNRAYSELYQMRGEIYLELGRTQEAKQEFEKAVRYNENYQPAKDALSSI